MRTIHFPDWQEVLECDGELSAKERAAHLIAIRWFLSYCRKVHRPATKEQAYAFIEEACELKQPTDWMVGRWKEAINWFFRHAPKGDAGREMQDTVSENRDAGHPSSGHATVEQPKCRREVGSPGRPRGPEAQPAKLKEAEPEWRLKAVKGIRIRQFQYETEKTYLNRLNRFARYWKTQNLESLGITID